MSEIDSLKLFDPYTPSMRGLVLVDKSALNKGGRFKPLVHGKSSTGGRNNAGRVTAPHRGGGHKQCFRSIDYKRSKQGVAVVQTIEYDPNRTSWISLIKYESDNSMAYIIAPHGIKIGDRVESGEKVQVSVGSCMTLGNMPLGVMVHNVELKPGKGGSIARSAGSSVCVTAKDGKYVLLRLRSGEVRYVLASCRATVGSVSNTGHKNQVFGKAGRMRWLGRRPRVRGVAMNPVDHPLGGGEGKTSGGRHPVSRTGKCAKGKKTRGVRRYSDSMIKDRRK